MDAAPDHGVRAKEALLAQGWVRRYLADPHRAQEALDAYTQAGFEVRLEPLEPRDFGELCQDCAAAVCTAYVVVYTRRAAREEP